MIYVIGDSNRKQNLLLIRKAAEIAEAFNDQIIKLVCITKEEIGDVDNIEYIGEADKNPYPVDEIVYLEVEQEAYDNYKFKIYPQAISVLIQKEKPDCVLFFSSPLFREVASEISVRISNSDLLNDCISLSVKEGVLEGIRPSFDGKGFSHYTFRGVGVALVVMKDIANIVNKERKLFCNHVRKVKIASLMEAKALENDIDNEKKVKFFKKINCIEDNQNIKDAELIFAGGRGLMNEQSFLDLRKLAESFGAAIGASRPVVDCGWANVSEQVGQTGSFVRPKMYIAFGISGAIQHLAGIKNSECIIAVNSNKNSPIFQYSDYAIYADANSIIRNMLQLIQKKEKS